LVKGLRYVAAWRATKLCPIWDRVFNTVVLNFVLTKPVAIHV
jgi:hypothetical protein